VNAVPQAVIVYQLLYRTTDLTAAPRAAITSVITRWWISDRFAENPDADPGTRTVALLTSSRTIATVLATFWTTLKLIFGRALRA
jgi:hypothetical protein